MPAEEGQKLHHVCLTCSRPFNSKRDLIKHQYMHREKPQLDCSHCNKTFATESNYKRHLNSLQNNEKKRYHCNNCGKFFKKLRDLESHHDSEHRDDKVFRCEVCQAEFCWHENLLKHKQVHDVDPHVCVACGQKFIDLTSLLVHKRTFHMSSKAEIQKKPVVVEKVDTRCQSDGGKPFTCHICGRGFKFDFSYQAHLDGHVIPATEDNCNTNKQTVTNDPPVSGNTSKSLYVQMDNEGIIDFPALNATSNEEVEIIVEVGNVATSGTIANSSPSQQIMINNTTEQESMVEKSSLKAPGEKRTLQESSNNILKDPDEQTKALKEEPEKIITFYEPYKKRNTGNQVLQTTVSRAEVPHRPYFSRPKKPPRRKREKIPFQYNCVMTDDKPFVCSTCGEAFRWEISLQVHIKVHAGGKVPGIRKIYMSGRRRGTRAIDKTKNGSSQDSGAKKSRIVYQRHSSEEDDEEEEDAEDADTFQNSREEDKSALASYQHDKRFAGKKFDAETADDMLQEYLAGGDFSADDGCNENQLELATKNKDAARTNLQSDGRWQKGRIIFSMANTEKVDRLKSSDCLRTAEAGSDEPVATECDAKVMASGNEIDIMTEYSISHEQNFAVACVEGNAKDVGNASQFGVIGSCMMATFPFDLTTVTNDNGTAMATTYSVTSETVSIPVVMQNGFKQEKVTEDGGQLMMLQCIPFEGSCLPIDKTVLISGTHDKLRETADEVSVRPSDFIPMVQIASSEITSVNINDCCITHEPTEFKSAACVSNTTSEPIDTGTNVIQVNNAVTCSDNLKSGSSTRVIFFADENPIPQVNKVEEPPRSYSLLASQAGDSQVDANFAKTGISSVNQKTSAGLVALKKVVTGAQDAGLKASKSHLENSTFESLTIANSKEDIISNAVSDVALQNEEEQTVPKKRLECTHCGKLFTLRTLYVKHLRRHSHVRPNYMTCTHCSKMFFSKASLDRHLMLHTA